MVEFASPLNPSVNSDCCQSSSGSSAMRFRVIAALLRDGFEDVTSNIVAGSVEQVLPAVEP